MISRNLFFEDKRKKLRIFDFDDVLVKTKSFIYITHKDGSKSKLTPGQFAIYNEKPGDEFDYSDFDKVIDPTEIKAVTNVLRTIVQKSAEPVFILTARAAYKPIRRYLKDIKINTSKIFVRALASNRPSDKADWIEDKIDKEGYNDIYFADDSPKNVKAVKQMLRNKEGLIKWRVQHIKY